LTYVPFYLLTLLTDLARFATMKPQPRIRPFFMLLLANVMSQLSLSQAHHSSDAHTSDDNLWIGVTFAFFIMIFCALGMFMLVNDKS
jgi:hypothetical protein